jgi:bifunctional UDP-N-acetylglucosamine pyrophosphorylase/glucosamine-1-phosphate N-acetyltransferase
MVAVAILAAGKGTRMKSDRPKVLHELGSHSLVERTILSCRHLQPERLLVVIGYQGELVKASLAAYTQIEFVEQKEQLGTGHAVQQLLPYLQDFSGDILILNGDVPLLRTTTLANLLRSHKNTSSAATVLTAHLPDPYGYGRVFCDGENFVSQIVEERDCTPAQKHNRRINAGVYCFAWPKLAEILPRLGTNNDQGEYYLTDTVKYLKPVVAVDVEDYTEIIGINDRKQLAGAYQILQQRIKDHWMSQGVTIVDPLSVTIDDAVQLTADVVIEPQTHLRGQTTIGTACRIGPGTLVENSQIGPRVNILYSVVSDSVVQADSRIGPYAHLRGHSQVGNNCRIGNFVELKNTQLGDRTNAAHLAYLGDATLGQQVNIGAGTITANYDGRQKHRTQIGDRCKIGANSVLVAPITLGPDVTVAAGSAVTESVVGDALVIARSRQTIKPGWRLKTQSENQPEQNLPNH